MIIYERWSAFWLHPADRWEFQHTLKEHGLVGRAASHNRQKLFSLLAPVLADLDLGLDGDGREQLAHGLLHAVLHDALRPIRQTLRRFDDQFVVNGRDDPRAF